MSDSGNADESQDSPEEEEDHLGIPYERGLIDGQIRALRVAVTLAFQVFGSSPTGHAKILSNFSDRITPEMLVPDLPPEHEYSVGVFAGFSEVFDRIQSQLLDGGL